VDRKKTILIVEDEKVEVENLEKFLTDQGYAVIGSCSTGEEAVQKALQTHPDLILMDIRLEGVDNGKMDGVDAAKSIHNKLPIPVIYLTGHVNEDILQRVAISGRHPYITKPYKFEDVINNVKIALFESEKKKVVLLVDDSDFFSCLLKEQLEEEDFDVAVARTLSEVKNIVDSYQLVGAIIDRWFHIGDQTRLSKSDVFSAGGGFRSGLVLAKWIKKKHPGAFLIGYSQSESHEFVETFEEKGSHFISKTMYKPEDVAKFVCKITGRIPFGKHKCFIVHGHDDAAKFELLHYLNKKYPETLDPIVLHEQAGLGRPILKKFEDEAKDVELVFVLLTPDDKVAGAEKTNDEKRRARQNVIFEMGYFISKFALEQGRVILLHKGKTEMPSDISGLSYIDISNGIEAASEKIQTEVNKILPAIALAKTNGS
jgi:predicted nucleotide-binding protein/DNA-binding response OmpR family regulator